MAQPESWTHVLTEEHIRELESAVDALDGRDIITITQDQFPLPTLGPLLDSICQEVVHGRGFALVRGLPVQRWSLAQSAAAYFGMGTYIGDAVSQNAKGHVLGHVKDIGGDPHDPKTRIYTTSLAQPYHVDSCDVVGLLCLKKAKEGGHSNVVSSSTVYNEVLKRRPDLAKVLVSDFLQDRKGEVPEGEEPWFRMPVFIQQGQHLVSWYDRTFITAAQKRFKHLPRLTPEQDEALDLVDSLCSDPALRIDMTLEPGDVQLLHNHQTWHARTEYHDWSDEARKRHLLRLWLSTANGWELPEQFRARYGNIELGSRRGGISVPGQSLIAPLAAS